MKAVFKLTNSSKRSILIIGLLIFIAAGYFYYTGDKRGFWICALGMPGAILFGAITLTTTYIVDDTGITVTGKLMPTRRFRWEEIVKVTCTRIKPFSPLPFFPTEIRYKLEVRPPSPGKFAPYVNLSTDNIQNVDQLIREVQAHLPPSVRNNTNWELK